MNPIAAGLGGASCRLTIRYRSGIVHGIMTITKLDLTGLKCPLPALKTRKALKGMKPGERLEVHCTDPMAIIDIPNLLNEMGDRLKATERSGDGIVFLIEKIQAAPV
ncbi:sulfurtransferase TusA family protein [Mesorhizobium sp. 1B3]|uniref:sulfurtransferase TusA family protein n=1 Tax=Mesorhizobium sp. 1B3 TaxID=3243599 RepID=UPI003D962B9E